MELNNGLFGLRLSHSLHLGHIVGNIRPAMQDQNDRTIIVVLADLFTYTSDRRDDITEDNAISMVAEAMSLGLNSDNVKFVIQSKAFNSLSPLFVLLSCLLKFDRLKKTAPIKGLLANNIKINFGELTFPIVQCAEMVSTNSEILYSNNDNLGIVSLTKDLYKKLQNSTKTKLPKPRLCCGEFENVYGIDHKKMSQKSGNAIFVDDTLESTTKKITAIDTSKTKNGVDMKLLFDYFKIIGYSDEAISGLKNNIDNHILTPQKIKSLLSVEINNYFKPINEQKKQYIDDKRAIIERINNDTETIKKAVEHNINCIFQNFYEKDFYFTFKK